MADGVRDCARKYLEALPPYGQAVESDNNAAEFTRLTGLTHQVLKEHWGRTPMSKLSSCNSFAGTYGRFLGSREFLGSFNVDLDLAKAGKESAWVAAGGGKTPGYGDVILFSPRFTHMCVSLDYDGVTWNTAEGGAVTFGVRDRVKRGRRPASDLGTVMGWVDIELYFAPTPAGGPVPGWLLGWWQVTWRGDTYYYYFGRDGKAQWTQGLMPLLSSPPGDPSGTGGVTPVGSSVTIRWESGTVEKFSRVLVTSDERMDGWSNGEPLTAVKM